VHFLQLRSYSRKPPAPRAMVAGLQRNLRYVHVSKLTRGLDNSWHGFQYHQVHPTQAEIPTIRRSINATTRTGTTKWHNLCKLSAQSLAVLAQ
jgi:hypothetical protein